MTSRMSELQVHAPEWFCARTQPKREHIAAANVIKRLGLEVFHPRLRLERSTRRGPVNVIEPLFPCYLFVRCRLEESLDDIRHIHGISSLVQFGSKTPSVPDQVIEELRQCFESEEPMSVDDSLFVGAEVTVADGALLGSRGIVVRFMPARQRVQILLDFLGRTTLAEVDRKSLTPEDRCLADLMPVLATGRRPKVAVAA
jgi:transcriptional antiterminator RfaH